MRRTLRFFIGVLAIAIPLSSHAQEEKIDRTPKISGFVQGLYQANLNDNGELTSNTFQMRRVRLTVDGNLTKTLSYKIHGDFSRSPMLVDAYVKYQPCKEFSIQIGQFKTPFSLEHPINPLNLEIFDYGESIQKLVGYNDVCGVGSLGRDLGVMASGKLFQPEGEDYSIVEYSVGIFNGNGANVLDNNNRKDVVGRLEIHPMLKALTLSASYYNGVYLKDELNQGKRNRWSAGAQYNDGDLVIRAEYLNGITGYRTVTYGDHLGLTPSYTDEAFSSIGYYAVAGYNFHFGKDKGQQLMPVVRYEQFTNNGEAVRYYTVGINYWPVKSLNFKLDYSFIDPENYNNPNSHLVVGILSYKF